MKRKREIDQLVLSLPSLEYEPKEQPSKKRRKSSRIKAAGPRQIYIEQELEEYIEYQFEFENDVNWNDFLKSNIFDRYQHDINDAKQIQTLFETFFVGMHIDFEDSNKEIFEAIIKKVRVCENKNKNDDDMLSKKYDIKLLIHIKHFSVQFDEWILLSSKPERIYVLRTHSNGYDAPDSVKPLPEILRELDELHIVSIDFIAETLQLDRTRLIRWLHNNCPDSPNLSPEAINKLLLWTKKFITAQSLPLKISSQYFVVPGSVLLKYNSTIFEAILPHSVNIKVNLMLKSQLSSIQDRVIDNLKNKKYDYNEMCNQCLIPLGLFQQIVFGINILLPQFIIDRVYDWSKGIHFQSMDLAIKEERLFCVKIQ